MSTIDESTVGASEAGSVVTEGGTEAWSAENNVAAALCRLTGEVRLGLLWLFEGVRGMWRARERSLCRVNRVSERLISALNCGVGAGDDVTRPGPRPAHPFLAFEPQLSRSSPPARKPHKAHQPFKIRPGPHTHAPLLAAPTKALAPGAAKPRASCNAPRRVRATRVSMFHRHRPVPAVRSATPLDLQSASPSLQVSRVKSNFVESSPTWLKRQRAEIL